MKVSKKTVITLCIIVPILALVLFCVLRLNQKPNFSKYHSYAVETESGYVPLTDEQFRQIAHSYINEDSLEYRWSSKIGPAGHKLILFKSYDMSGNCVTMYTGVNYPFSYLDIGNRSFVFDSSNPIDTAEQIIEEAIDQYESGQKV